MYVPDPYALHDQAAIAGLLQRHSFALLVTAAGGAPQANHLPFLYDPGRGPKGTLTAHLARANPQAAELERLAAEGGQALVVFQGPHAYVSPRWYRTSQAVPTWIYLAVHAYGTPEIVAEPARVRHLRLRHDPRHLGLRDPGRAPRRQGQAEPEQAGRGTPCRRRGPARNRRRAGTGGGGAHGVPGS